jgi:hypothetical protein
MDRVPRIIHRELTMPYALLLRVLPYILAVLAVFGGLYLAYDWAYDRGYQAAQQKYEGQLIELKKQVEVDRAIADQKMKEADERARAQEARWENRLKEVQVEYAVAQDVTQRRLTQANADNRRVRAELGELRNTLAGYAAGAGATQGAGSSDRDRAIALGSLLGEAVGVADEAVSVATEATAAAESAGDAVRALTAAWPQ